MQIKEIEFIDPGLIKYKDAWDYQLDLFSKLFANKSAEIQNNKHYLLFCEHPHVFTIGRNGDQGNLLADKEILVNQGIEFFQIERGGDITYHGPGQQVVYPIFDLDEFKINTKEYVFRLEDAVIETLSEFGIAAGRLEGAAGIWLDSDNQSRCRKICAIGIRSSKRITMHGLALNVNTDLSYFNYMNPCGFVDKGVSSMQKEIGIIIDFEEVKVKLKDNILKRFL